MKRNYLRFAILVSLIINFPFSIIFAQVLQPVPYDLSNGNYEFNSWDSSNPAGTYPSNTLLRVTDGTGSGFVDPTLSIPMNYLYTHTYNATSGSRIEGQGENGISFINIASGISSTDTLIAGRFVGALDLALITTGRDSIKVSWIGRTINPNSREYRIALQYRLSIENDWISIGEEYIRNDTAGHFQLIGPVLLPDECNNQPLVQLRWRYYYVETGIGGARVKLAVDDIIVESANNISQTNHSINLTSGWNTISSYVIPSISDLYSIFFDILPSINIIKNNEGKLFIPQFGINQIEDWKTQEGLMVNANQTAELNISGYEITPQNYSLYLNQGWNIIPYLRNSAMSIETALVPIVQNIIIVKNSNGDIYYPSNNINTIGNMQPGEGYFIYLLNNCVLTYPGY